MAYPISRSTWSREKVDSSNINNGNEYIVDDDVSLEQLNAIVNNSLYASDTADTALDNSNQAIETAKSALSQVVEKQGTVVTLEGEALSTWSADFAESERQKSKNLFNGNIQIGAYSWGSGSYNSSNSRYVCSVDFMPIEAGKNIILSCTSDLYSPTYAGFLFYDENYNHLSDITSSGKGVVPSGAKYFKVNVYYSTDITVETAGNIQVEYGTEATEYQEYHGDILHICDEPVVFAEKERQKSKNLLLPFRLGSGSDTETKNGITCTVNSDNSITINGTATARAVFYFNTDSLKNIGAGTYTFGYFSQGVSGLYLQGHDTVVGNYPQLIRDGYTTYTLTFDNAPNFSDVYISVSSGVTLDNVILQPIAVKGTEIGDYQAYNGAIVHEKELNEAVEKRDLLYNFYDMDISNSTLTTLEQYFDLFETNQNLSYRCAIGALETSNFKTLVGNPTGFGNYTRCFIKKIIKGNISNYYCTYKLIALDTYANNVATAYIYKNAGDVIKYTGWKIHI